MARKYSRGASKDVKGAMRKRKRGTLRSGRSGKKVKTSAWLLVRSPEPGRTIDR